MISITLYHILPMQLIFFGRVDNFFCNRFIDFSSEDSEVVR